uniref:Ig-like domain-containing protein n=1 Tax=Nothobranchius furzeri TaxID=105023 RepID=A0A8C6LVD9_NOTFU
MNNYYYCYYYTEFNSNVKNWFMFLNLITCFLIYNSSLVSADVGDSVTLRCSFEGTESAWVYWYKQTLGQKPKLMSSFFIYGSEITFYDEFRNDRFTLIREKQTNSLTISDLKASDSASYYCGIMHTQVLTFAEGATVSVKDTGIQTLVHQSASETIRLEGSVTLNCSVQTGTCDGEHSVYWFKDSKDSRPGLIYSRRGRNDQCEREPNTQTHTCVYNLPLNNLNASHTGTYYCAVASCGHILFGNGTTLNFSRELDFLLHTCTQFFPLLTLKHLFGFQASHHDTYNLHYASINVRQSKRSRRQSEHTETNCVYSIIKQDE